MANLLRRINWLMLGVFSLLSMGLMGITIYLADDVIDNPALPIGVFFFMEGVLAYAFYLMGEGRAWKWLSYPAFATAGLTFFIYVMTENYVHPALGFAAFFFFLGGLAMILGYRRHEAQRRIEGEREGRFLATGIERDWNQMTQAERDEVIARDR